MKKIGSLLLIVTLTVQFINAQYVWRHKACLPGPGRVCVAFSVGNKGYVIGGPANTPEVWMYDPATNVWTQKNSFPGASFQTPVFVINDTAYAGLGLDSDGNTFPTNFWKYNATADQWTQVASFPGNGRYQGMAFALNGKGYVGCGKNWGGYYNDFYEYDPSLNTWTQKANFPGASRQDGIGAAVGNYGYMGMGYDGNAITLTDCYRYDPNANTWSSIASYGGGPRSYPGCFVINDTLYMVAGGDSVDGTGLTHAFYSDCWRYDIADSTWVQQEGFGCFATPRQILGSFVINGWAYLPCGGVYGVWFNDLLEFGPVDTTFTWQSSILGNDTSYCGNFSRTLSVYDSCAVWSNGTIGPSITIDTAGTYWVRYNDSCGVWADTLKIGPGIPSVSIDVYGDTLKVIGGSTYQWYFNDTLIPGATTNIYVATQSGYYSVIETDSNDCKGASGGQFITLSIASLVADGIKVYPNPLNSGNWQLIVPTDMIGSIAAIYDDNGRLVYQSEIRNQKSEITTGFAPGLYYLRIKTQNGVVVKKLVKL